VLSSASVSALFSKQPSQVKLSTMSALCTALQCTPNDLLDCDTAAHPGADAGRVPGTGESGPRGRYPPTTRF
jgi:hypothetical protein